VVKFKALPSHAMAVPDEYSCVHPDRITGIIAMIVAIRASLMSISTVEMVVSSCCSFSATS